MFKKLIGGILTALMVLAFSNSTVKADERDNEIKLLKAQVEALQKRIEKLERVKVKESAPAQELAQVKPDASPKWLENIKPKADFRLRYEWQHDRGQDDNYRLRIRARAGLRAQVNKEMAFGAGIATGRTNDPRSTNVTLGTSGSANTPASAKDIVLNYAYGEYKPFDGLMLTAGKFQNPLWLPTDILWDSDINPDGVAVQLGYKLNSVLNLFANNMYFIMRNDDRNTARPFMFAFQPGFNWEINDTLNFKGAVSYYGVTSVEGKARFSNQSTNSLVNNNYKYDYGTINPSFELGVKEPVEGLIPYFGIFGDYVSNFYATKGRAGYDIGFRLGYDKIDDKGQWRLKAMYVLLERDAWLDIFPESSRYSGRTNIRGVDGVFEYGIAKNSSVAAHYYCSESLTKPENPQHILQVDWNLRF
ncbi:MAG: putative porin [Candidatus Omnitrophota bacterium]